MWASRNILQVKLYDILGDTKGIKRYINDIYFLRKEIFSKHI